MRAQIFALIGGGVLFFLLSLDQVCALPRPPKTYPYWIFASVPESVVVQLQNDPVLSTLVGVTPRGDCSAPGVSNCGVVLSGESTILVLTSDERSQADGYIRSLELIHMSEDTASDFDQLTAHIMNNLVPGFFMSFGQINWIPEYPTFKL